MKNTNDPTSELVQALVSRLEKLEAKLAEMGGLLEKISRKVANVSTLPPGITPQLMAVITAALDTVIKEPHLIHSIRELGSEESSRSVLNWSVEGRRQIFSSHHIR